MIHNQKNGVVYPLAGTSNQIVTPLLSSGSFNYVAPGIYRVTVTNAFSETISADIVVGFWKYCAHENGICNMPGPAKVRYGISGHWVEQYINTTAVSCSNGQFGDPAFKSTKYCEYSATY